MAAQVILLNCGSFNPVTNAHLRMFEIAKDHLHATETFKVVGGIISPTHDSYGKQGLESAKHRCEMVKLALASSNWVRLDKWESSQPKWTTTREVISHYQRIFNAMTEDNEEPKAKKICTEAGQNLSVTDNRVDRDNNNKVDFKDWKRWRWPEWDRNRPVTVKLLCGGDLLESFGVPGLWETQDIIDILHRHGIVVISRHESNPTKAIYESDLLTKYKAQIVNVTEWITNDISSTKIRRALRRENSVKYLLQDSVIAYIALHGLYKPENDNKYMHHVPICATPSPSQDANLFPPSYEIVRASSPGDKLELPVATHKSSRVLLRFDPANETLV